MGGGGGEREREERTFVMQRERRSGGGCICSGGDTYQTFFSLSYLAAFAGSARIGSGSVTASSASADRASWAAGSSVANEHSSPKKIVLVQSLPRS